MCLLAAVQAHTAGGKPSKPPLTTQDMKQESCSTLHSQVCLMWWNPCWAQVEVPILNPMRLMSHEAEEVHRC